jgi:predicted DNA-binding mobile mystery protein A
MNYQWVIIKQLDRQLKDWQLINRKHGLLKAGWIQTLRKALGMTANQLGERLGVMRSRIVQLENAEKHGAITLRTLQKAAEAMNCELVYAVVPKNGKTLKDILTAKATEVAETTVASVSHSMSLEKQSIAKKQEQEQQKELTKKLLSGSFRRIWRAKNAL